MGKQTIEGTAELGCNLIVIRTFRISDEDPHVWNRFIGDVCKVPCTYPDNEHIRFHLRFNNGLIFGRDPAETNYGDYLKGEKEPTEITKILSRIDVLETDAKHFSTLSPAKVFP